LVSYSCQRCNLKIKPWESPPLYGDVAPNDNHSGGRVLLERLQALNLSRYEPDPLKAIAEAEAQHPPPAA